MKQLAREETRDLEARIRALEAKTAQLEADQLRDRQFASDTADSLEGLRGTFNRNVDRSNREKVAEMTARGDCGTQLVRHSWGAENRKIPCTEADLARPR